MPEPTKKATQQNPLSGLLSSVLGIPNLVLGPIAENLPYAVRPDGRISLTGLFDIGGVTSTKKAEAEAMAKLNELRTQRISQELELGQFELGDAQRLDQGRPDIAAALQELGVDPRLSNNLPGEQLAGLGKMGGGSALDRAEEDQRQTNKVSLEGIRQENRLGVIGARGAEARKTVAAQKSGGADGKGSVKMPPTSGLYNSVFSKTLQSRTKVPGTKTVTPTGIEETEGYYREPTAKDIKVASRLAGKATRDYLSMQGIKGANNFKAGRRVEKAAEGWASKIKDQRLAGLAALAQEPDIGPLKTFGFEPTEQLGERPDDAVVAELMPRIADINALAQAKVPGMEAVEQDPTGFLRSMLERAGIVDPGRQQAIIQAVLTEALKKGL